MEIVQREDTVLFSYLVRATGLTGDAVNRALFRLKQQGLIAECECSLGGGKGWTLT